MSDLDGFGFIRRGGALVPADVHAEEWLDGQKEGREILISGRRPRSPQQHRFFFAMLKLVGEQREEWSNTAFLLDALKMATGHADVRRTLAGANMWVPKSIAFASMDQDAFQAFMRLAVEALAQHTGIDGEALMAETDRRQGGFYINRYGSYK